MAVVTIAVVSDSFGRDLDECMRTVAQHIETARARGAQLLVLPEAALGGYLLELTSDADPGPVGSAPLLDPDGPEIARLVDLAGDMVVCIGYSERAGHHRYNSAVCVGGGAVLGRHRKVHLPLGEVASYEAGDQFRAFDTPIGRIGMLVCYDKAFPESARSLALAGAEIIVCLSAWPMSRTHPSDDLALDRWRYRFDVYDEVRALENQVVWVSANQVGQFGSLTFVGNSKIVHANGTVLAATGDDPGMAMAHVDVEEALHVARRSMNHLRDRRPEAYDIQCLLAGEPTMRQPFARVPPARTG
ncbi:MULTISPECIES: carbon-nitrogen hydrolase family protein [unclassified Pseudofrankia]|uniref:carbon-nitrogen hydrolase family protein n=1 Tax=unclassified Pseudofrankia TaxID=2994372 RepID=UPI0008DA421C|nr:MULTISPECIES: carbon-nitrogen hydrolase family protein [unclassified Pseudofrankia]MDT3439793.1 carbon-nitrogen hydrolase family protein [Pseudofrankia sp. BMG5.37]OHV44839.1 acyltransferase [Pseudofrankia sp. BMG5.36]